MSRLGGYLEQIWIAANDGRDFVEGMSKEDFLPISELSKPW